MPCTIQPKLAFYYTPLLHIQSKCFPLSFQHMPHNPTTEPLSMLFCLPGTQVLNCGFTDESQGVCEPHGSACQILYTLAHVHLSGKQVHRIHQTYKGVCDPRLFKTYSLSSFFQNNPNSARSQPVPLLANVYWEPAACQALFQPHGTQQWAKQTRSLPFWNWYSGRKMETTKHIINNKSI